ncbi:ATP-dependent nuclease [Pseudomonas palleroniana]
MITAFKLKFGRKPSEAADEVLTAPVNIFVGPNNSGKSKVLSEIMDLCKTGVVRTDAVILSKLSFKVLDEVTAPITLQRIQRSPDSGTVLQEGQIVVGKSPGNPFAISDFVRFLRTSSDVDAIFCQWYLQHDILNLKGGGRTSLVNDQVGGDLQKAPTSSFQTLLRDRSRREEVRRIVYDAFGSYFVIDPTNLGKLKGRLSTRPPFDEIEELGLHSAGIEFHKNAADLNEASDGVKAFIGMISEIIAGDPSVLIVDEPEAFLHPSIATKLGYEICRTASKENKCVFASTHSSAFLMGCIQSGVPINIIRLTYDRGAATSRVLPAADILKLMRHPLLRSAGVLSALFYGFVIVTESDADRVFYQEVNERLLQYRPDWGIKNCLFINAQNKQTIQTIVKPLRQLGIPAVSIVDVDVLKDGGSNWTNLLISAGIPSVLHDSFAVARNSVKKAMDQTGKDMKRDGGISILDETGMQAASDLLDQLAQYGVFVVPGGELECWLSGLEVAGHGPNWVVDMFGRMGEDPDHPDYVKPDESDVWVFMSKIRDWLHNPSRKGIPN